MHITEVLRKDLNDLYTEECYSETFFVTDGDSIDGVMLYLYQDVFEDDEEDMDARTKFSWFVGRMAYYTTLLAMGDD